MRVWGNTIVDDDDRPRYEPAGDWRRRAACRGLDANLFFTERGGNDAVANAKAVCRSCPSLHECAVTAICDPQLKGVWGGLTQKQRDAARSAMGRMLICAECAEPFHSYPGGGAGATATYCGDVCRRAASDRSRAESYRRRSAGPVAS